MLKNFTKLTLLPYHNAAILKDRIACTLFTDIFVY